MDRERRLYVSGEVLAGMRARALALLAAFHEREPLREGLPREELRQRLSGALAPRVFERLVQSLEEGGQVQGGRDTLRLAGRGRTLSLDEAAARTRLGAELAAAGLSPPTLKELAERLGLPDARVRELLRGAVGEGRVVRVSEELFFDAGALAELQERLIAWLREKKEMSTQDFKEWVGLSRKFVIPLAEHFDRVKVTLRVGEKRVLRRA